VPVTFGHCFLFLKIFYSLFFTALDALPCPALPLPCFEFSFCCQGQEEEVTPYPSRQTDRHVAFIYKMNIISRKLGNYSDFFYLEKFRCQYLYYVNNPTTIIKYEIFFFGERIQN
jgi:hypothetical protein